MKIQIIGCGLIGTSIGLRLASLGHQVWLSDINSRNLALAKDLIPNSVAEPEVFDLIVIATPVKVIKEVLKSLKSFNENSTVIDIGGLKSKLLVDVATFPDILKIFVSAHPMAGREFVGPENARADLFEDRAWLLTFTPEVAPHCVEMAKRIGLELGATTYILTAEEHDSAIAAISHMPQIISSLMGALIAGESESALNLAGQGLRDVSRLANSEGLMWSDLLIENSEKILPRIKLSIDLLQKLYADLSTKDIEGVFEFLAAGKSGRKRIPGKHGAKPRDYSYLPIVIDDKPGQLARIFEECALCEVNVEDLTIEHSPNQERGLITLALSRSDAEKLKNHLHNQGWLAQEIQS